MKKCLAFVLGGGGARGAMQVGAIRALLETGLRPDLLVGTSIGAANAAALALWGLDGAGIERLEQVYEKVADDFMVDPRAAQFMLAAIARRPNHKGSRRIRRFLIAEGLTPELRFKYLPDVRLAMVGADLHTGEPVIYGEDPDQSVLDGVMASTAVPPWFAPVDLGDGHYVVDGGAVSNLPIEPAIMLGATEIVALDLADPNAMLDSAGSPVWYLNKFFSAVSQREVNLEMALAAANGVPVHHLQLRSSPPVPIWDFSSHTDLFQVGYDAARKASLQWGLHHRSRNETAMPIWDKLVRNSRRRRDEHHAP